MKVRGLELALHPTGDYVSDVIRETGDYFEAAILDEVRARVCGGTLIDVGAHIGNHSAYLSRFVPHAELHAFEPVPANLALLRTNARGAVIHPIALGDESGPVRLTIDANIGHSHVDEHGRIRVPMRTLDSFDLRDVTLLKVDVEGFERQVLAGAAATIERCRPQVLIEDWLGPAHAQELLPGYQLVAEWEQTHQTFLYAPA